eukprot:g7223.t1
MGVKIRFALLAAAVTCAAGAKPTKTNFMILFVDDMGFGDLGSFGAPTTSTPNIDALAASGMRFTQWYSAHPICTPSRAGMVTGRLPIRNGLCGPGVFACDAKFGLPKNETTFAAALAQTHRSMAIGKWHLGQQWEFMPKQHGFDEYFGVPYSVDMGRAYHNRTAEASFEGGYYGCTPLPLVANETVVEQPTDLSQLNRRYTDEATRFITHATQAADAKPWLLYLAYGHVHTPQYAGAAFAGASRRGVFGDSVMELDASVGELVGLLAKLGIAQDTLVFLTSDNGAPNAAQHAAPWLPLGYQRAWSGSNGPFLGEKTTTWEGGLRVPGIVAWPGTVAAGSVSQALVSTMDVFGTLLDVAGVPLPAGRAMDTHSLLPLLTGTAAGSARNTSFFYRGCELAAVRHRQYKLHLSTTLPATHPPAWDYVSLSKQLPLLFDIEQDPSERFPLLHGNEDVVAEINAAIAAHRAALGAPPAPILGIGGGPRICCDQARNCTCTPPPASRTVGPDAAIE